VLPTKNKINNEVQHDVLTIDVRRPPPVLQFAATSCKSPTSERREPSWVRHAFVHLLPERETKRDQFSFFQGVELAGMSIHVHDA